MLYTYIKIPQRIIGLFHAFETIPCVAKKSNCSIYWIETFERLTQRIFAFSCVEGIFFKQFLHNFLVEGKGSKARNFFSIDRRGLILGMIFVKDIN